MSRCTSVVQTQVLDFQQTHNYQTMELVCARSQAQCVYRYLAHFDYTITRGQEVSELGFDWSYMVTDIWDDTRYRSTYLKSSEA